jgi:hypothetical protein
MRNQYTVGKVENKRGGESKLVTDVVKKFGPISSADIRKKLAKHKASNISWHISQLAKDKCIVAVKASKKEAK